MSLAQTLRSSWCFVASSDSDLPRLTLPEASRQVGRQQLASRQGTHGALGVSTQGHQGDPVHVEHASEE